MKELWCFCQLGALSNLLNEVPDRSGMAVGKNLMQLQGLSDQVLYGPFLPQIFIFLFIVH